MHATRFLEQMNAYFADILGETAQVFSLSPEDQNILPGTLSRAYHFQRIQLFEEHELCLMMPRSRQMPTVSQFSANCTKATDLLGLPVVLGLDQIPSYVRRRLIQARLNFILPGRQMFIPSICVDLNERGFMKRKQGESLLPSAQYIILYQLQNKKDYLKNYSFKELASLTGYSAMTITKAAENMRTHDLCEITGKKEKHIRFHRTIPQLWTDALPHLDSPVLKTVYAESLPNARLLNPSGTSALARLGISEARGPECLAIEKSVFYEWKEAGQILDLNEFEGAYCLEIWKYAPLAAPGEPVDLLSLSLCMKDLEDETVRDDLAERVAEWIRPDPAS
ncbi:MAG: hypothetical protein R2751_14105 [Bacteroidales bacterium]